MKPSMDRFGVLEAASWTLGALLTPWRLGRLTSLDGRRAASLAGLNIFLGAALSGLLSTWTYLVGKALVLGLGEADMGHDDLPADTPLQVGLGFLAAAIVWVALLGLLLGIAAWVARRVYEDDGEGRRRAVRQAWVLTIWFPVCALAMLLANGALRGELRHPASAIRARAQLRLDQPDDLGLLNARERSMGMAFVFTALWGLGLARSPGRAPVGVVRLRATAMGACWLSILLLWRLLPWSFLNAWAG
jgi:hypothetical protein